VFNPQPKPIKPEKKPKARIKPVSKVHAKELRSYFQKRKDFLETHKVCQAKLIRCEGKAVEVHHCAKRGKNLNNESTFMAVCAACHNQIERVISAVERRERGFLK